MHYNSIKQIIDYQIKNLKITDYQPLGFAVKLNPV